MTLTELPYHKNSANLFEHFLDCPHAVFLDSCFPYQTQGRFDIISAWPEKVILVDREETNFDLFTRIQTEIDALKPFTDIDVDLPFTIGAIGYLSYDIGRHLEKIPAQTVDDINLPQAVIGIYHWSIVVDHHKQKTYLVTRYPSHHSKRIAIENQLNHTRKTEPFALTQPFQSNMTKDFYQTAFEKIKKHIYAGNCYQINFAQRFGAQFAGSTWSAYQVLREKHPAPFSAFMQVGNGSLLSLSPERFLKVNDQHVETKPIKGTMPRHADPIDDLHSANTLLASEKDKAENVMIVDLLRNDLSRVCKPGTVQVPKLFALESFSNVHHLVSTITGKLHGDKTPLDLLKHCFPGGSITGAPKISAMQIIESLEPHRRSIYCGSLFYADVRGYFDSNITIRTLIAEQNKIFCYAGGGIVYDSDCDKEYAETWAKVGKIIQILSDIHHANQPD